MVFPYSHTGKKWLNQLKIFLTNIFNNSIWHLFADESHQVVKTWTHLTDWPLVPDQDEEHHHLPRSAPGWPHPQVPVL
jgi:hypothetical protein